MRYLEDEIVYNDRLDCAARLPVCLRNNENECGKSKQVVLRKVDFASMTVAMKQEVGFSLLSV